MCVKIINEKWKLIENDFKKIFFEFCREIKTKLESVLQGKKLYQVKSTTHHKKFVMNNA